MQPKLDPSKLIFLDESGAKTNMTRLWGRALRNERVHDSAPNGRWQTTTMISSIRLDGTTATMAVDGPTDTEVFRTYVARVLLPMLRPGDIVIMDNLTAHKNKETIALIESTQASVRFLPPYSPDLNPIEMMWSKVKAFLRKFEARTTDELNHAIGKAIAKVTQRDAINWFAHCSYNFI